MVSQITSVPIVYSTVCSGADQRKHQSSASLVFVRGIHRWQVNSPHKGPVTRKTFPFMTSTWSVWCRRHPGLVRTYFKDVLSNCLIKYLGWRVERAIAFGCVWHAIWACPALRYCIYIINILRVKQNGHRFGRRYFQTYFHQWKLLCFDANFTMYYSKWFN